jgi:hypothetical protein
MSVDISIAGQLGRVCVNQLSLSAKSVRNRLMYVHRAVTVLTVKTLRRRRGVGVKSVARID